MSSQPVIEFRSNTGPFPVLASPLQFTGSGFNNAIVVGTSSNVITLRIYNNFTNAGSIGDALNCVLSSYDSATQFGAATIPAVTQRWLQVQVVNYDGSTTGADSQYYAIGGSQKHAIPTNGGTLSGSGPHYTTVNCQIVVPVTASAATITQGLWLEYTWI